MRKKVLSILFAGAIILGAGRISQAAPTYFLTGLGYLSGESFYSSAWGLNDSGQVVGESWSALGVEAFLWSPGSGMTGLGDLPGGGFSSWATGINNSGQVVGGSNGGSGDEAFLWEPGGGMTGLGTSRKTETEFLS